MNGPCTATVQRPPFAEEPATEQDLHPVGAAVGGDAALSSALKASANA